MSMAVGGRAGLKSDPNITPFIDVLLVLLVIFMIALPLIFQQFRDSGKTASPEKTKELLETVKIYNPIPAGEDDAYAAALLQEYAAFCEQQGAVK